MVHLNRQTSIHRLLQGQRKGAKRYEREDGWERSLVREREAQGIGLDQKSTISLCVHEHIHVYKEVLL